MFCASRHRRADQCCIFNIITQSIRTRLVILGNSDTVVNKRLYNYTNNNLCYVFKGALIGVSPALSENHGSSTVNYTYENKRQRGFPSLLQLNADSMFIKPWLIPCALFPIHCNPFLSRYKLSYQQHCPVNYKQQHGTFQKTATFTLDLPITVYIESLLVKFKVNIKHKKHGI